MILRDISFKTPQENILFDDVLLYLAEQGKREEILRFWESSRTFIVLGRISLFAEDVKIDEVKESQILVLRRSSGGGTVVQGRGCLNYSLILLKEAEPRLNDLKKSYQWILGKVVTALDKLGVEAQFQPICDIALSNCQKKFSGNAQKRARRYILHHGTILYDFELNLIEAYLKIPKAVPIYRGRRTHLDFLTNIPIEPCAFKKEMKEVFAITSEMNTITQEEQQVLDSFLRSKEVVVV